MFLSIDVCLTKSIAFQAKTTKQQKISTNKYNKNIIIYFSSCFYLLMFIRGGGTVFQTTLFFMYLIAWGTSRKYVV